MGSIGFAIPYYLICELINRNQAFETFRIYPEKDHLMGVRGEVRYQKNIEQAIKLIKNYLETKPVKKKTVEQTPPPAAWRAPDRKKDFDKDRPTFGERKKD